MQSGRQFPEGQGRLYRLGVADEVQVVRLEIDYPTAIRIDDGRILDIPLWRNLPIEHARAARHLVYDQRHAGADQRERLTHAGAGEPPAGGLQPRRKLVETPTCGGYTRR